MSTTRFLVVGFHRPNLPFVFPASVLQHYPENEINLPDNPYAPINLPHIAWASYQELRQFNDIKAIHATGNFNTTLPNKNVLELRRTYYSAVTWMDSQVGRVLDELDRLNLSDNTIISFFGDHGWQLGEHGEWCKHTNFDIATHAPMMIRVPENCQDLSIYFPLWSKQLVSQNCKIIQLTRGMCAIVAKDRA